MSKRYGDWLRGWKEFRAASDEYQVVDDHRILVFVINSGYGRTSGVEFEQRSVANYFEIRGDRVTKLVLYWDRGRALTDAGMNRDTDAEGPRVAGTEPDGLIRDAAAGL